MRILPARGVFLRPCSVVILALLSIGVVGPWVGSKYHVSFMFFLFLNITMAATYDVLAGYTGYMNLGHGAFFGLGAYVYGLTIGAMVYPGLALAIATLASCAFATLVGSPLLRLRGAYFAIGTFGILKMLDVLAANLRHVTGGTTGLSIAPTPSTVPTFYLMLAACVLAVGVNAWIASSRLGLGLLCLREDEEVAEASGIKTRGLKRNVFVLSAILPGLAGGIYMWQMTYVDPNSAFGADTSIAPVIMAMLGGSGTVAGPVVGALALTFIEDLLWSRLGYLQLTMYGLVLVFVGVFMPGGLMRSRLFIRAYRALGLPDHYGYRVSARANRKL